MIHNENRFFFHADKNKYNIKATLFKNNQYLYWIRVDQDLNTCFNIANYFIHIFIIIKMYQLLNKNTK